MMYRKYSMWGGVEWQIQHKAKLNAVFAWDPTPSIGFFCTSQVNGALTDSLFMLEGLVLAVAMDSDGCV